MNETFKRIEKCVDDFKVNSKAEEWTPTVRKLLQELLLVINDKE